MALVWNLQLLFLLLISCHYSAANCDDPTVPTNGSIYGANENTTEGTVIEFGCNPGFVPAGNTTAVCASDGRWIPEPATLVCTFVSQVYLLPWHIALITISALALLVASVIILTRMFAVCGFRWCCWNIAVVILMSSTVGVPIGLALILHNSKKAAKNEQCRKSVSRSNNSTCSGQAGCYYALYYSLTILAFVLILNGLVWWFIVVVFATIPPNDGLRDLITPYVLTAFCLSIAALVSAIVAVIFIIPYCKYKRECKVNYDQMGVSHKVDNGDNPEDENMKEVEDY